MSIFWRSRPRVETRSITSVPWIQGGDRYSTISQHKALTLGPVFSANRHITDFGSTLPLKPYRSLGGDEQEPMPALPSLFGELEVAGLLVPWLGSGISSLALRGNAVGLVTEITGFGFPAAVTWVSMDRVFVDDSVTPGMGQWYIDGRKVSLFHRGGNVVWIPWITVPGQTLGLSPIAHYARTIGVGLDAQQYGGDWFKGGGFPPAVFKNVEKPIVGEDLADGIADRLVRAIRRRRPLVVGKDWDYTPVNIPPEEAQFIEAQKLTANQVAAIYGIAPEEVGGEPAGSLTYLNEEHRQTVRAHNVRPYLVRFERAFASWLPNRQFVRFNVDAITRADLKTRYDAHHLALTDGWKSKDDVRADEDLPPLPDGQGKQYGPMLPTEPAISPPDPASRRLSVIPAPKEIEQ